MSAVLRGCAPKACGRWHNAAAEAGLCAAGPSATHGYLPEAPWGRPNLHLPLERLRDRAAPFAPRLPSELEEMLLWNTAVVTAVFLVVLTGEMAGLEESAPSDGGARPRGQHHSS